MLTEKQKELLLFIHSRMQESGVPPSFDEMKDALDLKSKSGIHRLITALVERGFIRRLPHRARAIEVIRLPENAGELRTARRPGFQPSVIVLTTYWLSLRTVTSAPGATARNASITAVISIRLFVVDGSLPLSSRSLPSGSRMSTPHPPGPGLPRHAPSVYSSTFFIPITVFESPQGSS